MSTNVEQLIAAAVAGLHAHAAGTSTEDVANACLNLALRAGIAVLDGSEPSSVEHNRAALLDGVAAIETYLRQWPIDTDAPAVWN